MKSILILITLLLAVPAFAETGPWVITTDYSTFGRVESFAAAPPWTASGELATIPGDAVGHRHQGLVYIVGRGGSNLVRIHDPADDFSLVREFSVGAGRNPQDIAFDRQGRAFVSCYDEAVLLQVDTATGTVVRTFDTSAYADGDGLPETAWLRVVGDRLYVTCQKLDRANWYSPTGPGLILVLDLTTLQWLPALQLSGANPYTEIQVDGHGRLLVGCAGYWAVADGGLEAVDPVTGSSHGFVLSEAQLGGDLLNFDFTGGDRVHALTSDASFATRISRADTATGTVVPIVSTAGYDLADLAWDGTFQLYVADRTVGAAGLRVFDSVSGAELTTGPVSTGLPPFQVIPAFAGPSPVAAAPSAGLTLSAPFPNPCNPAARLDLTGVPNGSVSVSVFDLRGRRVDRRTLRTDSDGRAVFRFDGRDAAGSALPTGLYRVTAQGPGGFAARSVTLVK